MIVLGEYFINFLRSKKITAKHYTNGIILICISTYNMVFCFKRIKAESSGRIVSHLSQTLWDCGDNNLNPPESRLISPLEKYQHSNLTRYKVWWGELLKYM